MRHAGQDNVFLRWASNAVETVSMPLSGYVWEENGEIIGNVSLIPHRRAKKKYYLIANVAVQPKYRNKGIGRKLTHAAMEHAKLHNTNEIWLQVREDNPTAIGLYFSMGFVEQARRTAWQAQPDRTDVEKNGNITVTKRASVDWPLHESWLRHLYPENLNWYQPMPWKSFHPGIGSAIYRFMSDYEVRHWVARKNGFPTAIISWQAMAGRNNQIWVAVPQEIDEEILTRLLQYVRHELAWREKINLDLPAGLYKNPIEAAGFHPQRTLIWMRSNETYPSNSRKSI
jgi:GNAT superfamily N-acetyltransferase